VYLSHHISYKGKNDRFQIRELLQILGLLNNPFKWDFAQRTSRLKSYKSLALPNLLHCSEIWIIKNKIKINYMP
jgi:hypothetical protein